MKNISDEKSKLMTNSKYQIGVSIDAISHVEKNIFKLRLIPDFNSKFSIPVHTRHVYVKAELLENRFLSWINEYHYLGETNIHLKNGRGSVVQGGYYILNKRDLRGSLAFYDAPIYDTENDIFQEGKEESPYEESGIRGERLLNVEENETIDISTEGGYKNDTYLYGFYVGQGDMLLLITSAKNAYLIDTNFYNNNYLQKVIEIKSVLRSHGMDEYRIKGLIITHKHSDHLRGAYALIDTGVFRFDNLIMNLDYIHPTRMVKNFLQSAKKIPTWINLNKPCSIIEGNTTICFKNPDVTTRLAPDINDSSIVMCVRHGGNHIYLTGDACSSILERSLDCKNLGLATDKVIKVSHHGSRTGTNDSLINMISPSKAFISAGYSKTYKHPHKECTDILRKSRVATIISKASKGIIGYQCNGTNITQTII